jgi:phage-related protein
MKLSMAFMPLITSILPPLTKLLLALVPIIKMIVDVFTVMLMPVIDIVASLAHWLGDVLGGAINWIVDCVKLMTPIFKEVFGFIGSFIRGIFEGVIGFFKGFINFIIDGINTVIGGLNFVLDGLAIASAGTIKLHVDPIPKLAKGGIVMPSPGGSLVNVAEAGKPEAIVPLDRMGSMGGGSTYTINVTAGAGANGATIGTEIVNAIKAYERSNGKGWRA